MTKIYVGDLAKKTNLTSDTITNYIRTGQIKGFKEGKFWYVESMEEWERFLEEGVNREEYLKGMKKLKEEIKNKKNLSAQVPQKHKKFRPKEPRPDISLLTKEEYTSDDLQNFLNLTSFPVNKRLRKGIIKGKIIGNKWIITKQAIIDYVNEYFPAPEPTSAPVELFSATEEPEIPDYFIECKSRRVQLLIQPSLYDKLKERADIEHDSVNNLVVRLLTDGVNKTPTAEEYVKKIIAEYFRNLPPQE